LDKFFEFTFSLPEFSDGKINSFKIFLKGMEENFPEEGNPSYFFNRSFITDEGENLHKLLKKMFEVCTPSLRQAKMFVSNLKVYSTLRKENKYDYWFFQALEFVSVLLHTLNPLDAKEICKNRFEIIQKIVRKKIFENSTHVKEYDVFFKALLSNDDKIVLRNGTFREENFKNIFKTNGKEFLLQERLSFITKACQVMQLL
jgi:hypothetical protein